MPHVTIQYTANLDPDATDGRALRQPRRGDLRPARRRGRPALPDRRHPRARLSGRTFAVADGAPDRAFVYLNVRIAPGRDRNG
jgi:5-carboxymethyl-2-hydroxymuconate isomerase